MDARNFHGIAIRWITTLHLLFRYLSVEALGKALEMPESFKRIDSRSVATAERIRHV